MAALASDLRKFLERTVVAAREIAEAGAGEALRAIAVHEAEPHSGMSPEHRSLRNRLRAHAKQLGDPRDSRRGTQEIRHLSHECAYEYWHRMLFARCLAENGLLIEPEHHVPVSIEECRDVAREQGIDPWELASRFAQRMLPEIFRPDDPVLRVPFSPEHRGKLEALLEGLPEAVFEADDALGWVYQFWQAREKEAVNRSGVKIGADEIAPVTQLFTEHYMVLFLLHNTVGAWHAGKVLAARPDLAKSAASEDELREACAIPGYEWEYLRFVREEGGKGPWRPAAGTFEGWPKSAKEIAVLDPCCGSGHFLVAALECLVRLRMYEEGLSREEATRAVLAEGLHGLEIDARCTQIAAFAVAFSAWKSVGRILPLPSLKVACSGLSVGVEKEEWVRLGGKDSRLRAGMGRLHDLFGQGPILGSLIDPRQVADGDVFEAGFGDLAPLLHKVLKSDTVRRDAAANEAVVTAQGMANAAALLARHYTLILTNVPYLARGKQDKPLKGHIEAHFAEGKPDLATAFVLRCLELCGAGGTAALVTPQNWLFLTSYTKLRESLLKERTWNFVARLGANAFRDMNWWAATTTLVGLTGAVPHGLHSMVGIDVSASKDQDVKASMLRGETLAEIAVVPQASQLDTPDARLLLTTLPSFPLLGECAVSLQGISPADVGHFGRFFWEIRDFTEWKFWQGTVDETIPYGGRELVLWWGNDLMIAVDAGSAFVRGEEAWGRTGVVVRQMRHMPSTLYTGEVFDTNCAVVLPHERSMTLAIWAFCSSDDYRGTIRELDQKTNVTNATLVKVPFDLAHWQKIAAEKYPNGLPEPESDDPTQWLFHGHPARSTAPLQVAVARLLGYRWPPELDPKMRLAAEARALVKRCDDLLGFADADGIVCLAAVQREEPAADRLRALLAAAFGTDWSPAKERELVSATGAEAESLADWLRDDFFAQHCALFHHRPFVWHLWDGRKDGFHAFVNYHRLAEGGGKGHKLLQSLAYSYLGDWIARQKSAVKRGDEGADARLAAALELQGELEKVLAGEPPYDLFVRWKPLSRQPIGWAPDINDGVRMNIRPFMSAALSRGRSGAGVLRWKPNIKWDKDRGVEPSRPKDDYPWFWGWDGKAVDWKGGRGFTGDRQNACHYTNAVKQAAREGKGAHK
ncbi:MAG: SAM-dependent DNA methyltransferase [Planctomycetes bacterium]|nr:SAM-dependent DNA methyltransferase [Planctomycetota bacterium]